MSRTYTSSVPVTEQYRDRMAAEDFITTSVTIKHTLYKENCIIILDAPNNNILVVGLIKKIVFLAGIPHFWVRRANAVRNEYREFCVDTSGVEILIHYSCLKSYKPLSMHGYEDAYTFFLYGAVYPFD